MHKIEKLASFVHGGYNTPTFILSTEQLERLKTIPSSFTWRSACDDLKMLSGIIYVIRHGLRWKDAPREYDPYKTLYNRVVRWSRMGVFNNISEELAKTASLLWQKPLQATTQN